MPRCIVSIDNSKCKVEATGVKFRLYREFRIEIGTMKYEVVDLDRFNQTMILKRHNGVQALTTGEVASSLNLNKCRFTNLNRKKKQPFYKITKAKEMIAVVPEESSIEEASLEDDEEFMIMQDILPSSKSKLLHNEYFVETKVKYDSMVCNERFGGKIESKTKLPIVMIIDPKVHGFAIPEDFKPNLIANVELKCRDDQF